MIETESKREDKFESFVKKVLRKADENRNYVVGGVVAILLVAGAIYFKVSTGMKLERQAWGGFSAGDSVGILRDQWKKFGGTDAGFYLGVELAARLFDEQREMAGKEEQGVVEQRLTRLDEGISVLESTLERNSGHPFAAYVGRMLESFRAERDWVFKHGKEILAAKEPVPKKIAPEPEKQKESQPLENRPGQLPIVTLKTDLGEIVIELFEDDAPNHVANFISLVLEKAYDGLIFHRVEDGLVQTGCPDGTGLGGPGYRIRAEINKHKHVRGIVGMARSEDMDSAGSQFYVMKSPEPGFDERYTVFGRVLSGMEVVDRLKKGDKLVEVTVDRLRKKEYRPLVIYTEKKPAE